MNKKSRITLEDAYSVKTPADSVALYGDWASSYDADFADEMGYVAYWHIARILLDSEPRIDGPVLDVGCGTGLVGACLREGGIDVIDGIDISPEMLAVAGKKTAPNGLSAYRNLIEADLTKDLDIRDNSYAGLVSAGTFTHGHLGPEPLGELWRIAAPGAVCAIGIRTTHYEEMGFARRLSADVDEGRISGLRLTQVNMYAADTRYRDHADDKAFVVTCRVC